MFAANVRSSGKLHNQRPDRPETARTIRRKNTGVMGRGGLSGALADIVRRLAEVHGGNHVGCTVTIDITDCRPADEASRPVGRFGPFAQPRAVLLWTAGSVELGGIVPQQRPILSREGQERVGVAGDSQNVASAVTIEIHRRLHQVKPPTAATRRSHGLGSRPGP